MRTSIVAGVVVLVLLIACSSCVYIVNEWQQAIVVMLGKPVGDPVTKAGIHFRIPFFQTVHIFDKRILAWDGDPERIPTLDNKFIFVDAYARWQISDALRFYQTVVDERGAQTRLDDILDGTVRDVISSYPLAEIVRSTGQTIVTGEETRNEEGQRKEITSHIFERTSAKIKELELGIKLIDFQVKRIDYTSQVQGKVYERMISEQQQIAEKYRAQGTGGKAEIEGQVEKRKNEIESDAYRQTEEIRGKADATATRIYARAYNQDPEFYQFVKSLETYRQTLKGNDTLILTTKSDLYRYLKSLR
ncbi:MAG TPA: protease modulator HflC [Thermoanaerobaculia bacterium]|nr:protease modulator HflC [Thermoanaerobaculia bacterium]HUM30239.1 protease modulator HflC [Thermoanaerobaculia bacterium]HXK68465.1 protease modulator HflC [Thermoanaerobaculia bacterium]